jgi:hypothetical protein
LEKFNDLMRKEGIVSAVKFAEENDHASLWKILAEKCLLDLDYLNA